MFIRKEESAQIESEKIGSNWKGNNFTSFPEFKTCLKK